MTFLVLVPAHDEAAVIQRTLAALHALEGAPERREIVVIADHCADGTSDIARGAGATVLERRGGARGKGAALAWALERMRGSGAQADVVVIVDADCVPAPNLLDAIERRIANGAAAVQADYVVANPDESAAAGLRYAAFRLQNTIRPRGREALGLSVGLQGTGMAFTRDLLERYPLATTSLVEDQEQHLALQAGGERVAFAAETAVESPMPTTLSGSADQQLRWESGRVRLLRAWGPPLFKGAVRHRDPIRAAALVELLVPPQSLLLAGNGTLVVAAAAFDEPKVRRLAAMSLAGQVVYVLGGLMVAGAPASAFVALALAPALVVQKLALVLRLVTGRGPNGFIRTERGETVVARSTTA